MRKQRKVGTTAKEKEKRNLKKIKQLKRKLKNCVCPHCGFGFEQ